MANPRVKDGYIAFANELWKAMMRTGPLEERVFKAILWECWGWEDRRKAKEPIPITRGRISKLTGIAHKGRISSLINSLVAKNMINKHVSGKMETCCFWPNQDYESWIQSGDFTDATMPRPNVVPRPQSEPMPRPQSEPMPRPQSEPTSYITCKTNNKTKENKSSFHPLLVCFQEVFAYDVPNNQRMSANAKFQALEELPEYDLDVAKTIIKLWNKHAFEDWRNKPGNGSLPHPNYLAAIVEGCLKSGKMPGEKQDRKPRPLDCPPGHWIYKESGRAWIVPNEHGHIIRNCYDIDLRMDLLRSYGQEVTDGIV